MMSDKSQLVAEIIDNIRRVFQAVNEYSKRAKRETGLTGPQLWAIKIIAESAPIKVSDLARRMYLHPATVVGILDRLEAMDLVSRTRSREDRRVVDIDLTGPGRNMVEQSPEVAQGLLVKGLEQMSAQRLLHLDDGLEKLAEILGAKELPPKPLLTHDLRAPSKSGKRIVKK